MCLAYYSLNDCNEIKSVNKNQNLVVYFRKISDEIKLTRVAYFYDKRKNIYEPFIDYTGAISLIGKEEIDRLIENIALVMKRKTNNLKIFTVETNRGRDIELILLDNGLLRIRNWKINMFVDDDFWDIDLSHQNIRNLYKALYKISKQIK